MFLVTNINAFYFGLKQPTAYVDRILRICFLLLLLGPVALHLDMYYTKGLCLGLLVLYMIPYTNLQEQKGGYDNLYLRRFPGWRLLESYFNVKTVKTVDLDAKNKYIFGMHPHGIMPLGGGVAMNYDNSAGHFHDLFPGIDFRFLAATFCFYIPLYRDVFMYLGVVDAARYSAKSVLEQGKSIVLVPGGATEALYCSPEKDILQLRNRKGFVRLAIEHGAHLVPVFSFNENNAFDQFSADNKLVNGAKLHFQRLFGLSLPLISNIFPKRANVTTVIGAPIETKQYDNPSDEMVKEVLDKYIESLEKLYDEHSKVYNEPSTKPPLEIL
eukprot:Nk52_evm13s123 gene=Nk52_evmTU13s123